MPLSTPDLIAALVVIAVAAFVQGVVGIGFNVLAVPMLLLIDPLLAPMPNLLLAVPLSVWQLLRERGSIDRSGVKWILLGRLPGGVIGLILLLTLSTRILHVSIALFVLGAVFVVWRGTTIHRSPPTEFGAGTVSGITGIIGAIGGPPVGLLYRDAPAPIMRSTVGMVFTIGILLSISFRAIGGQVTADDFRIALVLLPAMLVGFAASNLVKDRVDPRWMRRGILLVSTIASVALLLRSLLG